MLSATAGVNTHKGSGNVLRTRQGIVLQQSGTGSLCRPRRPAAAPCNHISVLHPGQQVYQGCGPGVIPVPAGGKRQPQGGQGGIPHPGQSPGRLSPNTGDPQLPVEPFSRGNRPLSGGQHGKILLQGNGCQSGAFRQQGLRLPPEDIAALDREFIRGNLSPGGCADLLAAAFFLLSWEEEAP